MTVCPLPLLARFHYQLQHALYKKSRDFPLAQGFQKLPTGKALGMSNEILWSLYKAESRGFCPLFGVMPSTCSPYQLGLL